MSEALPAVQMLWVDGPLSTLERLSIASFLRHGHAVHLYTYGEVPNLPAGAVLMDGRDVWPDSELRRKPQRGSAAGSWAFFSNLFRYRLLHDRGGIWSDCDVVCVRPLEFAAQRPRFFATERTLQTGRIKVATCMMQVPAGDKLIAECFDRALKIDGDAAPWASAGPDLVTELVNKNQLSDEILAPEVICSVDWWSFTSLIHGPQMIAAEAHAIHFWNEVWSRNFFDKEASYDPLSVYERLKSYYFDRSSAR